MSTLTACTFSHRDKIECHRIKLSSRDLKKVITITSTGWTAGVEGDKMSLSLAGAVAVTLEKEKD